MHCRDQFPVEFDAHVQMLFFLFAQDKADKAWLIGPCFVS